jgi:hypothetical protein
MAMFNSYVSLPEGNRFCVFSIYWNWTRLNMGCASQPRSWRQSLCTLPPGSVHRHAPVWLERSAALQPNEGPQPYPLVDHSCWTWAPNMGQIASPALGHIPRTSTSTIHQDRVGFGVFGGITQFYKSKFCDAALIHPFDPPVLGR